MLRSICSPIIVDLSLNQSVTLRQNFMSRSFNGATSFYRSVVTNASTVTVTDSADPQDNDGDVIDDVNFFKRLGKSTNHFWIDNAENVLQRLDFRKISDLSYDKLITENLTRRYVDDKVDLQTIRNLYHQWSSSDVKERGSVAKELVKKAIWFPNDTHENAMAIPDDIPKMIFSHGEPHKGRVLEFQRFCERNNIIKNTDLGNICNHRSYYLKGPLAELEQALIKYALEIATTNNFELISVPDILYPHVIESCGMHTRGERDQVFWMEIPDLKNTEVCLSGTSEMALGGCFQNKVFSFEDLPLKIVSVSRCYRAETSKLEEERGLYRVHEFTKVEMFALTANETGEEADTMQNEIRKIQENMFKNVGLHFKTLEMPPSELGLPAYRKFDIEAWMPGRKLFGEISSCSNCTDFQSRRLNIRYRDPNGDLRYVHTVNGTAMAIPRMLIALVETLQDANGSINLPIVLEKHMNRSWNESLLDLKHYKSSFMRTKPLQLKHTKEYRKMEFH